MEKVKEFLESDQKVFLLHGDSGAGKSTFSRELEIDLWQSYKTKTGRIPLHINLPAIEKPEHDIIAKQLRRYDFTEAQIREMKHYRKFILICDGYDEIQQSHNLYMSNRLNQHGEWDAQMIISCRTEYLGADYRDRFQPGDRNNQLDALLFQEAVIAPFSIDQVRAYIRQYVSIHQPIWQVEDYEQALVLIPSLQDLMTNPFLMTLSLDVLPRMVDPGQHLSATQMTRVGLYDHFVEQWLERGKKRIGEKELSPQARAIFDRLSDEGFTQNGIGFLKQLAAAIYKEQGGHPIVDYSQAKDEGSWKDAFFLRKDKQLLREACPLRRNGNQHRFIHRSLLEYGLARAVFDPQERREMASGLVDTRRGSMSSTMSIDSHDPFDDKSTATEQEPDINSPLVWRTFVNDHSLLQFLEERVQQEPVFKEQLFAYIEHSKKDKKWRKAPANAITILVRAGVQFNGADLRGIRIPRADLSYGVFDSAQLQDADLRKVNLRGVWLRQVDLSGAQMTSVQFGELPFLTFENSVGSCAYSPDGKSFVVCLANGNVEVHATSNWNVIRTLSGLGDNRLVYSPNGGQITVFKWGLTVQLMDPDTGTLQHTLTGHTRWINSVAYSPKGDQVASASRDTTVRLWDVSTGACLRTLHGHNDSVSCVAYSPKGKQIASCGEDSTIRMWDVEISECSRIIIHRSRMIVYSPRGDQIASFGSDKAIHLLDVQSGTHRFILAGHTSNIQHIAFSPKGDQLASGSWDTTVKLWDIETGQCRQTLTGHTLGIEGVAYSPNGNQVASCSRDNTIRLWDVSTRVSRLVSSGHIGGICYIKCSPKGDMIASGSGDKTTRLWDSKTGTCLRTLSGHSNSILVISFSPRGDLLASGSYDDTIRLWDVDTGACLHTLTGHTGGVYGVAFSPQGDVVASASWDKTVMLWNVGTGDLLRVLEGHTAGVMSVAYSLDGNRITSGSNDCTIRSWDAGTGECCQILVSHTSCVKDVVYSPQGNQLASTGSDKVIRLWDFETQESRPPLIGHTDEVALIAYSLQGDLLASVSEDKTARVWDTATGQCRAEIGNFRGPVYGVAWNTAPGDNFLVTSGGDGSVLKWEVTNEDDSCRVRLVWGAVDSTLNVTGTSVQGVHGLSSLNKQLLAQRGAVGEPEYLLRETGKKLITMASVVSTLKQSYVKTIADPSGVPVEQSEQEQEIEHPQHT